MNKFHESRRMAQSILLLILAAWMIPGAISRAQAPSFEDYATIEGECAGAPIYSLGNITYIYGVSPDLFPDAVSQEGNTHPKTKIKPKKSWEIKSNILAAYPGNPSVRTAWNDSQPLLPIHLIDGDPDTAWCSYGGFYPDTRPEWIRIDLPQEVEIASVALVCSQRFAMGGAKKVIFSTVDYQSGALTDWMGFHRWGGRALSRELTIQVSRDAWHWETVYETKDLAGNEKGATEIKFAPRRVKQILITANNFKRMLDKYIAYAWSLGEVEVRDAQGENLALVSRGAGVTVSSTSYLMNHDRFTQQLCWAPVLYDLGIKWVTICADEGLQCWNNVERVKGEFKVDPAFDALITDLNRRGLKVMMSLDVKANPIYKGRKLDWKKSRYSEINNSYYDLTDWAYTDPALLEPYKRYVEFIVRHFKGRTIGWYIGADWPGDPKVVQMLRELVKKTDPNAKMMDELMKMPAYPGERMDAGSGLDDLPKFFDQARKAVKEEAAKGYKGRLSTCLMTWAIYPPGPAKPGEPAWKAVKDEFGFTDYRYWCESEMQRAKLVAQVYVGCAGLNMIASYCNPYFSSCAVGQSLFRVPAPNQTITPMQPDAGYYVLRTIGTVMDEWKMAEFPVKFSGDKKFEIFTLARGANDRMVAAWIPGNTSDGLVQAKSDVTIPGAQAKKAWAIDLFNGTRQELNFTNDVAGTTFKGMLIKDYPVLIELAK